VPLSRDQQIEVPGPLGVSVITIEKGARAHQLRPQPQAILRAPGLAAAGGRDRYLFAERSERGMTGGEKKYDSLNY